MTTHETEVEFRGSKRAVSFYHEGDDVIVWSFVDENVCSGIDTTQAEQDAVYGQLWAWLEEYWSEPVEGDVDMYASFRAQVPA